MNSIGRSAGRLALLWMLLAALPALAEVTASLDRTRAVLGDSVRLTIATTGDEELSETDLAPLAGSFQVLQRSTSSQTRFVNGKRSHSKQLIVDLTPLETGTLTIPGLRVGNALTNALTLTVSDAPALEAGDANLLFQAELDRQSVYVQGQAILTLRVTQAINLEGRNVSDLELEGAFVRPLEQRSFQRTIDGRPWLVNELRYAIFPEQSGTLTIPAQVFTGREIVGRRNLFDLGGGGRLVRRVSPALELTVLPRPNGFPGSTWLPARGLTIEESWSTPPEQLRVGESATRTLTITGEGLLGAQLPPSLFLSTDAIKYYPDQPDIADNEVASGVQGSRRDSAALVPTRAGELTLPEVRIPWWDTKTGSVRYAVLPGRTLQVAPGALAPQPPPDVIGTTTPLPTAAVTVANVLPWQIATASLGAGWLLTLAWLWRMRRGGSPVHTRPAAGNASQGRLLRECLKACKHDDAVAARAAVIAWASSSTGSELVSLAEVARHLDDEDLTTALQSLDSHLYGSAARAWSGAELASRLERLGKQVPTPGHDAALSLYPQQG